MRTMIITGASSGVGRALAEHFAKQDWSICAIARTAEKLKELEANYLGIISPYICDISKADNVRQTFNTILEKHPAPDVLVNNAGVVTKGFMEEDELDIIDKGLDVNLKGTIYCTGAVVPAMKKAKSGLIINIASIAGLPGGVNDKGINQERTGYSIYGAAKAGIIHFSESIAKQLLPHGIRVTCLCPGGIETPLWEKQGGYPDANAKLISVEDMNNLIQFLVEQPNNVFYKNVTFFPINEWK